MTDKSDGRVGHLNTILARWGGNLQKFKCPALLGGVDVEVSILSAHKYRE